MRFCNHQIGFWDIWKLWFQTVQIFIYLHLCTYKTLWSICAYWAKSQYLKILLDILTWKPYQTLKATGSCHETFLFTAALFNSFSTSLHIGNFISQRSSFPLPSIAFFVASTTTCPPFASGSSSSLYNQTCKTHTKSSSGQFLNSQDTKEEPKNMRSCSGFLPRSGLGQRPGLWKCSHLR